MGTIETNPIAPVPRMLPAPLMRVALEKEMFFQDEPIRGEIWLEPQQTVILSDIIVRLKLQEGWVYNETSDKVISEINSVILAEKPVGMGKLLNIPTQLISLSAGQFHFPFTLDPPGPIQPSFEHPFPNRRGYVRYSVQAETLSQYLRLNVESIVIIKARPLVLNSPSMFSSCVNVHNWGFFQKGTTILAVSYPTNNYKIGDTIPLTVNIDNSRGLLDVNTVRVVIIRKTTFTKINQNEKYPFEVIAYKQDFNFQVPSRTRNTFNFAVMLRDNNLQANYTDVYNPYPYLQDFNNLMPSLDALTLKCKYMVKVSVYFNSYVTYSYRPRVIMPISVTHQLIDDYKLEKRENDDLQKALEASKIDFKKEQEGIHNQLIDNNIQNDFDNNLNIGNIQNDSSNNNKDNIYMSAIDMNNNNKIFQDNNFSQIHLDNNNQPPFQMNMSGMSNVDNSNLMDYSYDYSKKNISIYDNNKNNNPIIDPYSNNNNNNPIYPQIDNSYSRDFQSNVPINSVSQNKNEENSAPVVDINQL